MTLRLPLAGPLSIAVLLMLAAFPDPATAQPASGESSPATDESVTDSEAAASDEPAPAKQSAEPAKEGDQELSPAAAEFERQFAAWQTQRDETLRELETIRDLPIEERRELAQRTQKSGDIAVAKVLAAAEAAYKEDPSNERVENYLLLYAVNSLENDQIEDAARLSIMLLNNGYDPKVLASVAGRACLELGRADEAIKYLTLAQESGVILSKVSQSYLEYISRTRPQLDEEMRLRAEEALADDLPRVLLETTRGNIVIELFENEVPNAVANFIFLVEQGFYNDMKFFHVRPQYFAATGSPNDDGTGDAGYTIYREPMHYILTSGKLLETANQNQEAEVLSSRHQRYHTRGTVSLMALEPSTYGSQFMICHRYSTMAQADRSHMPIGRVIDGMNVATRLMAISPRLAPKDSETDRLIRATVIRKRDHEYRPVTSNEVMHATAQNILDLMREDRHDEALQMGQIALTVEPRNIDSLYATAICNIDIKDYERATELLERLIYIEPDNAEGRRQLARCYIQMDRVRDATDQLEELTRITPEDPAAFNNFGTMLMRQRRKEDAIKAFKKALELKPDYEQAQKNLDLLQ